MRLPNIGAWVAAGLFIVGVVGACDSGKITSFADDGSDTVDSDATPPNTMDILLGDTSYSFSCSGGGMGEGLKWQGPYLDASESSDCTSPSTDPRLWLEVDFTDFLASEGFPPRREA